MESRLGVLQKVPAVPEGQPLQFQHRIFDLSNPFDRSGHEELVACTCVNRVKEQGIELKKKSEEQLCVELFQWASIIFLSLKVTAM